jgi:hypothetical protein
MRIAPLRRRLLALALIGLGLGGPAQAGPAEEAMALYRRFVAAQNAHDFAAVRATLLPSPDFLWVTNGLSLWGPEAMLQRLMQFHANEIWRIDPAWDRARAVPVSDASAVMHVPLLLTVGRQAEPARYRILISALCVRTPAHGWRIAALFTTDANAEGWPEESPGDRPADRR